MPVLVLLSLICLLYLFFYEREGKSDRAVVELGSSQLYSKEELKDASECVKEKFKSWKGCTMTNLRYDEKQSLKFLDIDTLDDPDAKHWVVLFAGFKTGHSGPELGLGKNQTYDSYAFMLQREGDGSEWVYAGGGY